MPQKRMRKRILLALLLPIVATWIYVIATDTADYEKPRSYGYIWNLNWSCLQPDMLRWTHGEGCR